jgi:hypothetical protein
VVGAAAHDGALAVGEPALGHGSLQPGEPGGVLDAPAAWTEAAAVAAHVGSGHTRRKLNGMERSANSTFLGLTPSVLERGGSRNAPLPIAA